METIVKPVSLKWADIRLYKPVIHFITFSIWLMHVLEFIYSQVNRAVFVLSHCAVYISVQLVLEVFNTRAETPVSTQTQHSWTASIKNVILLQHCLDKFQSPLKIKGWVVKIKVIKKNPALHIYCSLSNRPPHSTRVFTRTDTWARGRPQHYRKDK